MLWHIDSGEEARTFRSHTGNGGKHCGSPCLRCCAIVLVASFVA
jgi:hypothetical protein